MAQFQFKITPTGNLKDYSTIATIESKNPHEGAAIQYEGKEFLLNFLKYEWGEKYRGAFVLNYSFGSEVFTQGYEMDPLVYLAILEDFQEQGLLTFEILKNRDWLEASTFEEALEGDAHY